MEKEQKTVEMPSAIRNELLNRIKFNYTLFDTFNTCSVLKFNCRIVRDRETNNIIDLFTDNLINYALKYNADHLISVNSGNINTANVSYEAGGIYITTETNNDDTNHIAYSVYIHAALELLLIKGETQFKEFGIDNSYTLTDLKLPDTNSKITSDELTFIITFPATRSIPLIRIYEKGDVDTSNETLYGFDDTTAMFNSYGLPIDVVTTQVREIANNTNINTMKYDQKAKDILSYLKHESIDVRFSESSDNFYVYNNDLGVSVSVDGNSDERMYSYNGWVFFDTIINKDNFDITLEESNTNDFSKDELDEIFKEIAAGYFGVDEISGAYYLDKYNVYYAASIKTEVSQGAIKISPDKKYIFIKVIPNDKVSDTGKVTNYILVDREQGIEVFNSQTSDYDTNPNSNSKNILYSDYNGLKYFQNITTVVNKDGTISKWYGYNGPEATFNIVDTKLMKMNSLIYSPHTEYVYTRGFAGELIKLNLEN